MTRTPAQQMADAHEADMAEWTGGKLQKGSGNQWHAQMDSVDGTRDRVLPMAGDGKATAGKSIGVSLAMWDKAVQQAGPVQTPYLALRWYQDARNLVVDQDLVVVSAATFQRLLSGARQWEQQSERLMEIVKRDPIRAVSITPAEPQPEVVRLTAPVGCRSPRTLETVTIGEKDVTFSVPGCLPKAVPGGCDCCR